MEAEAQGARFSDGGVRWGKDLEERQAVAQKAQDAYAAARSASARSDSAAATVEAMQGELAAFHVELVALKRVVTALALRVDELERGSVVPMPRRARKVA